MFGRSSKSIVAGALCALFIATIVVHPLPSEARPPAAPNARTLPVQVPIDPPLHGPPLRVPVREPERAKIVKVPASERRARVVSAVRPRPGIAVRAPQMLSPKEVDGVLRAAAAQRRTASQRSTPGSVMRSSAHPVQRAPGAKVQGGARSTQALPSDASASGTGINPWWRFQAQTLPGGGRLMANIGTGNVLVQDDDMSVAHKGITLAFRRTYNSQSRHDVNADDAGSFLWKPPGLYGNGWTNTFDASLVRTAAGAATLIYSVFDGDGTSYDYTYVNGVLVPGPGDHNSLVSDGQCGFLWTKKSGAIYYFYRPSTGAPCTNMPSSGGLAAGYAGRLYQIIGRNRNTSITFTYSWDNGDSSATGKVNTIAATTESGLTATLTFADVNGHRLLQSLTYPDGSTSVQYGYDANGNLTTVSHPANNAAGVRPAQYYGYQTVGSDSVLWWLTSPRWCGGSPSGCGYDGSLTSMAFSGSNAATSALVAIGHAATVNPTVADGTNTPLHAGYVPDAENQSTYLIEYFSTGVTTPTFRDTDGHMTNWVVDGFGRPTQTQECTQTTGSGSQCTGQWLTTNETWDGNNELTSQIDARGGETDYAYDVNGNTIAVAEPATTTSQGTFRPTRLYDYDTQNNVQAYCDESETNQGGGNWTIAPAPSDSLCSARNVPHATFTYRYDATDSSGRLIEPNGELTTITTPLGYHHHIGYDASQEGGADYGLPTSVSGDPITQLDGTSLTPSQTFWYDTHGSLRCYSKGVGTWVLAYDADDRMTAVGDPDDSSMNAGSLCGKTTGQPGWNTQTTTTYYPDGAKATVQTPSERAFGVSSSYTYDLDGDTITETTHHGCVPNQSCPDGTTRKWYDGADRLVEVGLPQDPRAFTFPANPTPYDHPPSFTRYMYDLSQSGTVSVGTSGPIRAYGNLYETLVNGDGPNGWLEKAGSQFDALDRELTKYSWAMSTPGSTADFTSTLETTQLLYDKDSTTLGLLAQKTNPAGELVSYTYNAGNKVSSETYANDGSRTANEAYLYDPNGRTATITSSQFGSQSYTYDDDGRLASSIEPNGGGVTDPATIHYSYYANGLRSAISVTSPNFTQSNALTYSYRADGLAQTKSIGAFTSGSWNPHYTDAGRPTTTSGVDMRSRSYDATGQLVGDTIRGNGITFTHDPEGSVLIESFPTFTSSTTMNYTYDVRGELIDSHDGSQAPTYERLTWVGTCGSHTTYPLNVDSELLYGGAVTPLMDARSCAPITSGQINNVVYDSGVYPNGTTNNVTYDVAGRAVHNVTYTASFLSPEQTDLVPQSQNADGTAAAQMPSYWGLGGEIGSIQLGWGGGRVSSTSPRTVTTTKTIDTAYDAENHTVSRGGSFVQTARPVNPGGTSTPAPTPTPTTTTMSTLLGWGPNGHPAVAYPGTSAAMTYHWDGDVILFVTDANGNVIDFKAGVDGEVTPGDPSWTGLTVFDRDQGGTVIDTSTPTQNFFDPLDTDGNPTQAAASIVPQYAPYYRADGFYVGEVQINGGRAFDATVGVWTTPDAYEGDIHDPMSQQQYMFNRNNAIDYSDPSGYAPWEAGFAVFNRYDLIRMGCYGNGGSVASCTGDSLRAALNDIATIVVAIEVGAGAATVTNTAVANSRLARANAARDTLSKAVANGRKPVPATVTAGYDPETGKVATACSDGKGRCAERYVEDALGINPKDIQFTIPSRPRTGRPVPVCKTCQERYDRSQFPPGTPFK